MKQAKVKPLTIPELKQLLKDEKIKFSSTLKVAELRSLCESHGLLSKPEEEVEFVDEERICIVKCAFRKAMNYDNEPFQLLQRDVEGMVHIISKMLRRSSLVIAYHFTRLVSTGIEIPDLYKQNDTYWFLFMKGHIELLSKDALCAPLKVISFNETLIKIKRSKKLA